MKILDMNSKNFINELMEAIGVKPGDSIELTTPQFERTDGVEVSMPAESLINIGDNSIETLKQLGCCAWSEPDENGKVLMLFPYQWYDKIPEGMELECISGEKEIFKKGVTDDDYRFGCIAYGVRVGSK